MKKYCERCLEEYEEGEIYPSKYFKKIFCIPCEKEYEMKFKQFCIEFMNDQADRLRRVDTSNSEAIVGSANIDEIAELNRND
jgi:hypothetical protein